MIKNRKILRELRQLLDTYYPIEGQIRTLAFDLGINWDDLPGDTRQVKIQSLILQANQHGDLPELVEIGKEDRPDLPWPDLSEPVKVEPKLKQVAPKSTPSPQIITPNPQPAKPAEETGKWGGLEWVEILAGNFVMGSDDVNDREKPAHLLWLDTFWTSKFPVTNVEYMRFVQASDDPEKYRPDHWKNWRIPQGKENHPVVRVSWHQAIAYCGWLSLETGEEMTLPSEAEWEKAARGTKGLVYPWGDSFDKSRCNTFESGIKDTTPVDQYSNGKSGYGVWDMSGNVWEWTRTIWDKERFTYPYQVDDGREALGENLNARRVLRGGSWSDPQVKARAASRLYHYNDPYYRGYLFGFRVCRRCPPISFLAAGR